MMEVSFVPAPRSFVSTWGSMAVLPSILHAGLWQLYFRTLWYEVGEGDNTNDDDSRSGQITV
jgi:hypothetical protein